MLPGGYARTVSYSSDPPSELPHLLQQASPLPLFHRRFPIGDGLIVFPEAGEGPGQVPVDLQPVYREVRDGALRKATGVQQAKSPPQVLGRLGIPKALERVPAGKREVQKGV